MACKPTLIRPGVRTTQTVVQASDNMVQTIVQSSDNVAQSMAQASDNVVQTAAQASNNVAEATATQVGNGIVKHVAKIYTPAQQIPVVRKIFQSIQDQLDEVFFSTSTLLPKTKDFVEEISDVLRHSHVVDNGIDGINLATYRLTLTKTEKLFQHTFFDKKDHVIDEIVSLFEKMVKQQRVEKIIDGVENSNDVARELKKNIMKQIFDLNDYEKIRSPLTLEEMFKHLKKSPVSPAADDVVPAIKESAAVAAKALHASDNVAEASQIGTALVKSAGNIYGLTQQIPIVRKIFKTIQDQLDEIFSNTETLSRTKKLAADFSDIVKNTDLANKGIEGFKIVADGLSSLKTEKIIQHIFFDKKDEVIDSLISLMDDLVKRGRVEKIIDGVEITEDVGRELEFNILRQFDRLNTFEKLRNPMTLEELVAPGLPAASAAKVSVDPAVPAVVISGGKMVDEAAVIPAPAVAMLDVVKVAVEPIVPHAGVQLISKNKLSQLQISRRQSVRERRPSTKLLEKIAAEDWKKS